MFLTLIAALCVTYGSAAVIPTNSCGLNKYHFLTKPYIVGGKDAQVNEFPYQVSLQKVSHSCGGSIINNRWILSAAHCFSISDPSKWTVIAGKHNLGSFDATEVSYKVEKVIKHEAYSSMKSNMNDVALMKLDRDIEFNDYIQPVCLADKSYQSLEKTGLITSGWGAKEMAGSLAPILQKVTLPVITNGQCQIAYPSEVIYDTSICAGNLTNGGIDSCQGDSGGPLVHLNKNGSFVQVGITSWGYGCALKNRPGVYTRAKENAAKAFSANLRGIFLSSLSALAKIKVGNATGAFPASECVIKRHFSFDLCQNRRIIR